MKLKEAINTDSIEIKNWLFMTTIMSVFCNEIKAEKGLHKSEIKPMAGILNLSDESFDNCLKVLVEANLLVKTRDNYYHNSNLIFLCLEHNTQTIEEYLEHSF